MSIKLSAGATVYQNQLIGNFAKTLSHTSVTKTIDNVTGDETLSDDSPSNISGAFYREEDVWAQQNPGLMQNADAILLVLPSVAISKDDKVTYDGDTYRIKKVITRRLEDVDFYKVARCFLI